MTTENRVAFERFVDLFYTQKRVHLKASRPGAPDAAVADLYRFEDGRIVEHWDVLQPVPPNAVHDHPMF